MTLIIISFNYTILNYWSLLNLVVENEDLLFCIWLAAYKKERINILYEYGGIKLDLHYEMLVFLL